MEEGLLTIICIKKFFWRRNRRLNVWRRVQVAKRKEKGFETGGTFSKGKERKAEDLEKFEKKETKEL